MRFLEHTSRQRFIRRERHNFRAPHERGVTIVEFAVVLPVFFLLIFGFFDIARYWQTKAALQKAGSDGVSAFAVNRDIKKKGSTASADITAYNNAYNQIVQGITTRARMLAVGAGGNANAIQVTTPSFPNDFRKEPIQVQLSAQFRGTFLPINVNVKTTVSGYAETFRTSAQPLVTDCSGRLYDATDPPGTGGYGMMCPCSKGQYSVQDWTGQCVCSSSMYTGSAGLTMQNTANGQQCGCPSGQIPVMTYDFAQWYSGWMTPEQIQAYNNAFMICCPAGTEYKCQGSQVRNGYQCNCVCGDASTVAGPNGSCSCSDGNKEYNPNTRSCGCKTSLAACPSGSYRDPTTCECKCYGDGVMINGQCGCSNPNQIYNGWGCYCPSSGVSCAPPMTFNNASWICACTCPSGTTQDQNGNCTCDSTTSGGTRHMDAGGQCVCDLTSSDCPSPMTLDTNSCICACPPSSYSWNGSCICSNPNMTVQGGSCACDPGITCPDPMMTKDANCNCSVCPSGYSASGSRCCPTGTVDQGEICCPPNATNQGGSCVCSSSNMVISGNQCICNSSVTCPDPMMTKDANCDCTVCPSGYVASGGKCCPVGTGNQGGICCPADSTNQGGICVCSSPNKVLSGNQCVCSASAPCSDPLMTRDSNCNCTICPSGYSESGGKCCPYGTVNSGGICCPSDATNQGGVCVCSNPGKVISGNQCVCNSAVACDDPLMTKDGNCTCNVCPWGYTASGNKCCPNGSTNQGGTCVCTNSNMVISGGQCVCNPSSSCSDPRMTKDASCNCGCPSGWTQSGGVCCPPGSTGDDGTCECDDGMELSPDGGACVCPPCTNGFSMTTGGGSCGCTCSTGNVINKNGSEYCSPWTCRAACTFNADGTCSQCPPG